MKKIFYLLLAMIFVACEENPRHPELIETANGYHYRIDTIKGHSFYYDNRCAFGDHECKKCEERFIFILDSIIDDRVVKLLGKE
jgi:hypothetical protein